MNSSPTAPCLRQCAFLLWQRRRSFPVNEQVEKVFQGIWEDWLSRAHIHVESRKEYKKQWEGLSFGPWVSHEGVSQLASPGPPSSQSPLSTVSDSTGLNHKASSVGQLWQTGPTRLFHCVCLLNWIFLIRKKWRPVGGVNEKNSTNFVTLFLLSPACVNALRISSLSSSGLHSSYTRYLIKLQ